MQHKFYSHSLSRRGWKDLFTPALQCVLLALALNLWVDILNQRSITAALLNLATDPLLMAYNALFILLTVSLAGFFRRRLLAQVVCCLPWLVLSIANFVLQSFRATPLSAMDFRLLPSVILIIETYLTGWQLLLVVAAIGGGLALLVWLGLHCRKERRQVASSLVTAGAAAVLVPLGTLVLLHFGVLSNDYSNLNLAYRNYGLPYCFLVSVFDRGIDKPDAYSEELVDEAVAELTWDAADHLEDTAAGGAVPPAADTQSPNVVFLQLESFIDADHLTGLSYSQDPTPYFSQLKEEHPSGRLTVPTFGAGTANTEFEVLTGMNLDHFGTGEYPYNTVLREQTSESVAYNLKEAGYYATAIHNNTATFYDRNLIFPNLGFDRFVSSEFMASLEYTPVGWCKDGVLTGEILKALESSHQTDLVYAISVQPHGKYPTAQEEVDGLPITVDCPPETDEGLAVSYTYYINQLREVDDFLRQLTAELSAYPEPVILVLFGDHLPNFELTEEDVLLGDLFLTEYVLWSNYGLSLEDQDLRAYQLSSYVLETIGCDAGLINQLHQAREGNDAYESELELMEYDMIFGDKHVWNGASPYEPAQLRLGYDDIGLGMAMESGDGLLIRGSGFTHSSVVFFDGDRQETVYVDNETLMAAQVPRPGAVITVRQMAEDGLELSSSVGLIYTGPANTRRQTE